MKIINENFWNDIIKMIIDNLIKAAFLIVIGVWVSNKITEYRSDIAFNNEIRKIQAAKISEVWNKLHLYELDVDQFTKQLTKNKGIKKTDSIEVLNNQKADLVSVRDLINDKKVTLNARLNDFRIEFRNNEIYLDDNLIFLINSYKNALVEQMGSCFKLDVVDVNKKLQNRYSLKAELDKLRKEILFPK